MHKCSEQHLLQWQMLEMAQMPDFGEGLSIRRIHLYMAYHSDEVENETLQMTYGKNKIATNSFE